VVSFVFKTVTCLSNRAKFFIMHMLLRAMERIFVMRFCILSCIPAIELLREDHLSPIGGSSQLCNHLRLGA
jgi:hypothetical protein